MTGIAVPGREPVTIVEIEQPRCALRFGTSPCTATGTPKCYQTFKTCKDKANFDGSGSIKWRFVENTAHISAIGDFSDVDNPETDGLPGLVSVSTAQAKMNVAGMLRGESPLGIRASVTVTLNDFPFSDFVGDFYKSDRIVGKATFWEKWTSRNEFYAGMYIRIYDGYRGQALASMRQRLYIMESVDGPSNGQVTITGRDPLRLADKEKAQFPRLTDIRLYADILSTDTAIRVYASAADVSDAFGNTATSYMRLGDEIFSYTGYSLVSTGLYDLTGVVRGTFNTVAEDGQADAQLQRVGYFSNRHIWKIAYDLITGHTLIPSAFVTTAEWDAEASSYLAQFMVTGVVAEPTPVETLLGELCQQGQFSMWWDEFGQKIKIKVVQPPSGSVSAINDVSHILAGSARISRDPSELVTRTWVYYSPYSVVTDLGKASNYKTAVVRVLGDVENANAANVVITREVFSRWIRTEVQALSITKRIADNYGQVPEFLSIQVDAKDRELAAIGTVLDVSTSAFRDSEGNQTSRRWQVVSVEEVAAGSTYALELQLFPYVGRFANIMADGSPVYASATEAERESGLWLAEDTGLMPDGSEGYKLR